MLGGSAAQQQQVVYILANLVYQDTDIERVVKFCKDLQVHRVQDASAVKQLMRNFKFKDTAVCREYLKGLY